MKSVKRVTVPPDPFEHQSHPRGMERGRLTKPIDDGRSEAERMEAFKGWQRRANR